MSFWDDDEYGVFDSEHEDDEYEDDFWFNRDFSDYEDYNNYSDDDEGSLCTVEDSFVVLPQLMFNKYSELSRHPQTSPDYLEKYETLYSLLVDLEILLKAWRRRTQHPFTAHLEWIRTAEDIKLGFRLDFFEGYDALDAIDSDKLSCDNEDLTKKKYCESTRMYYDVFASEADFDALLSTVTSARTYAHAVAFRLFLNNVPSGRLANELWEKIWTLSHLSRDNMRKNRFSWTDDTPELRFSDRKLALLEHDRLVDAIHAAGYIHMVVFDIMYHDMPSCLFYSFVPEEECEVAGSPSKYISSSFRYVVNNFRSAYERLQALDDVEVLKCDDSEGQSSPLTTS